VPPNYVIDGTAPQLALCQGMSWVLRLYHDRAADSVKMLFVWHCRDKGCEPGSVVAASMTARANAFTASRRPLHSSSILEYSSL